MSLSTITSNRPFKLTGSFSTLCLRPYISTDLLSQPDPIVDPSLLPPSKDPTRFRLVKATDAEILRQLHSNAAMWRGCLDVDQYLRREALLADQDLSRKGGMTTWILTAPELPEHHDGERVALSAVESFFKRALVKRPGAAGVEDVICHGVASVFTPDAFRKREYASVMMRLLAEQLKSHKPDGDERRVAFSVLYSDIGREFYDKAGWRPFDSRHVSLPVICPSRLVADVDLPVTKPIETADLPTLCSMDEKKIRAWFEAQQSQHKPLVTILPDLPTILWMHAREDFVCREVMQRYPAVKGAKASLGKNKEAWCYWTRMYDGKKVDHKENNTFYVLRIVVDEGINNTEEGELAVAALLQAAQREAAAWNMEHVSVWNPSEQTVRAAARALNMDIGEVKIVDRPTDSITSLLWFEEGSHINDRSGAKVDWVMNEKFAWC